MFTRAFRCARFVDGGARLSGERFSCARKVFTVINAVNTARPPTPDAMPASARTTQYEWSDSITVPFGSFHRRDSTDRFLFNVCSHRVLVRVFRMRAQYDKTTIKSVRAVVESHVIAVYKYIHVHVYAFNVIYRRRIHKPFEEYISICARAVSLLADLHINISANGLRF